MTESNEKFSRVSDLESIFVLGKVRITSSEIDRVNGSANGSVNGVSSSSTTGDGVTEGYKAVLKPDYAGILDLREWRTEKPANRPVKIRRLARPLVPVEKLFPTQWGTSSSSTATVADQSRQQVGHISLDLDKLPYRKHIPLSAFFGSSPRWAELPPRQLKLVALLENSSKLADFQNLFYDNNKNTWNVSVLIVDDLANTSNAESSKDGSDGDRNIPGLDSTEMTLLSTMTNPSWVLWKPNPVLEHFDGLISGMANQLNQDATSKLALDLGCGSGRDTVWLALRGWNVIGIDSVKRVITRAKAFSEQHRMDGKTRFSHMKLENVFKDSMDGRTTISYEPFCNDPYQFRGLRQTTQSSHMHLDPVAEAASGSLSVVGKNSAYLVVVSRTRIEGPFDLIDQLLAKGGLLVYHHFLEGCSHPNEGLLGKKELGTLFSPDTGYEIIKDAVYTEPTDGRLLSLFIACKK